MSRETVMDKETLAAFADGELSPEEAARVVMHLADHPQDQAYVDDLMAANAALVRAFAGPVNEPVPARFQQLLTPESAPQPGATVVPFRARLRRRAPVLAGLGGALAAAFVGALVLMQPDAADPTLTAGPVAPGSALHGVLAGQPSGQPVAYGAGELTVLASMPAESGFCREVELLDRAARMMQVALACHDGAGWSVDVAMSETLSPGAEGQDFLPASGAEGVLLDRWLERRGAGLALTAEEEAAAIAEGWAR